MAAQQTGTSGWLIIEDNGSVVTFKIQNTQGATHASGKSWSGVVNGVSVGGTYSISGAQTITLGSWVVTYNQTVTLSIANTGTSGLGGPSSLSAAVYRATVPPAPTMRRPDQITTTGMRVQFDSNGTGGSDITSWGLQRATDPAFTQNVVLVSSSGTTVFTDESPSTTYYYRARGQNAVGVGGWSTAISATTNSGAYASINGAWVPIPLYESNGSAHIVPELLVSNGSPPWVAAI